MSEIVNLRQARKRRARETDAAKASARRAEFGLPKAAKSLARSRREIEERRLDGARLARTEDGSTSDVD